MGRPISACASSGATAMASAANGCRAPPTSRSGRSPDCRRFWAKYRAGEIDNDTINQVEGNLATTAGTCAVMGTASTMASISEALGMILPGSAAIPAVHADRLRAAEATGRAAMMLAAKKITPDKIVTPKSVENALRVLMAIGGSTNAVLHLTAVAGRAGIDIDLNRMNAISDETPVLVDLKPTGPHYMEDLFAAGGIGAVLRELQIISQAAQDSLDVQREVRNSSQHIYVELTVSDLRDAVIQQIAGTPRIIRNITSWVDGLTDVADDRR